MKRIPIILMLFTGLNVFSQKQTFDLVNYTPPGDWKKETKDALVIYNKVDNTKKIWGQIAVIKSTASKGDIDKDFDSEWNEFAIKQYNATGLQTTAVEEADGWKIKAGGGQFKHQQADAIVLLTTMSGYNVCVSILATTNSEEYLAIVQNFLESVDLNKPNTTQNTNPDVQQNNQQSTLSDQSFTYTTTNFDDGWTSVIKEDWVEVTKTDMTVYLCYAVPYNGNNFSGTGLVARDHYWDNYVTKYFNVQTKQYNDNGEVIGSLKPNYVEGWATDKQTGEKRFIAMRLVIAPNTAYLIIASTKDEASLRQQFPNANGKYTSDLADMDRYNKFAVSENDILGTWQDGNTSTMQWYYTAPSGYEGYAGMTVAARTATFNFNEGGNYTSIHNGATGVVGNMNTFQQNYKGKYTVTNWSIVATNRWQGNTAKFDASFTVMRGGRVLKLNDNAGSEYTLVKVK